MNKPKIKPLFIDDLIFPSSEMLTTWTHLKELNSRTESVWFTHTKRIPPNFRTRSRAVNIFEWQLKIGVFLKQDYHMASEVQTWWFIRTTFMILGSFLIHFYYIQYIRVCGHYSSKIHLPRCILFGNQHLIALYVADVH